MDLVRARLSQVSYDLDVVRILGWVRLPSFVEAVAHGGVRWALAVVGHASVVVVVRPFVEAAVVEPLTSSVGLRSLAAAGRGVASVVVGQDGLAAVVRILVPRSCMAAVEVMYGVVVT